MKQESTYEERNKLLEQEAANVKVKHDLKMKELEFERENQAIIHEQWLQRSRINRSEERKAMAMKQRIKN